MREPARRPTFAPKVPPEWIVRLYESDAAHLQDDELVEKVSWRLYARCADVLMVSDSRVICPLCQTEFEVPWICVPADRIATCPNSDWSITAGAYHASIEHRDLLGGNARPAFEEYMRCYPSARGYTERMILIDRLVHALHTSGNFAARNLLEGRPRKILETLDALAGGGTP
jgi:hypothetical protein